MKPDGLIRRFDVIRRTGYTIRSPVHDMETVDVISARAAMVACTLGQLT